MKSLTLRKIIYPRLIIIMLSILILFTFFAGYLSRQYIYRQSEDNLKEVAKLVENYMDIYEDIPVNELQDIMTTITSDSMTRITIIRDDGVVVVDTEKDPVYLNNHANRPEIYQAFQGVPNSVIRRSATLNIDMLYYAIRLDNIGDPGYVLRVAMPYTKLRSVYRVISVYIFIGSLVFVLLSLLLLFFLDRKIERPLAQLAKTARQYADLDFSTDSFHATSATEIQEVFSSMRHMAQKIREQFIDVQHQKEALQAVLDGMREAVLVLNMHGEIIKANLAAESFFSTQKNTPTLKGKYYLQVLSNSKLNEMVESALQGPANTTELKAQLGDMYFQIHLSRIRSEEEDNILLVLNDITTLMHLEKVRSDFVANVSHELKTPVTSIKGFTETLLYGNMPDEEKSRRFLTIIHTQTERLQAIIDDLLTLSMLEQAHDRKEDFVKINVKTIVSESIQVCREKPGNENRSLSLECDQNISIMGNSLLIEQALINLIDNALKYSDELQPVKVVCSETEHSIRIAVIDKGFGIPASALDRIFERFYRVDKGRSRDKGGTGLGLSIVKHIVLQHQGTISVSSEEGEGSTFTLEFPKRA